MLHTVVVTQNKTNPISTEVHFSVVHDIFNAYVLLTGYVPEVRPKHVGGCRPWRHHWPPYTIPRHHTLLRRSWVAFALVRLHWIPARVTASQSEPALWPQSGHDRVQITALGRRPRWGSHAHVLRDRQSAAAWRRGALNRWSVSGICTAFKGLAISMTRKKVCGLKKHVDVGWWKALSS